MSRPAKGEMTIAHTPPRLMAPEKRPRDQPKCSVIGTTNTDKVATAINAREEKATLTADPKTTHP